MARGVRAQHSAGTARAAAGRPAGAIAITGAASGLGERLARRLAASDGARVVGIDTRRGHIGNVTWRRADVRDPALAAKLAGLATVVHLATDRLADGPSGQRRTVNVRGTDNVLASCVASGVACVVLVTSAMVYGAHPANPVPLAEDGPLRAEPDTTLVGDWVEIERLAARWSRGRPDLEVVMVRPASVVGTTADGLLPRLFEAPRLLRLRDGNVHWQFCHDEDLLSALEWAALGRVSGAVTVGCDGWLDQRDVERISGLRSIAVPASMAFATAERLHRVGVLPAPAGELHYLAHPWVVGSQRLRAAGWTPAWDNESALRAHLDALGDRAGRSLLPGRDATRAAAGATVALVGTLAIARARAARRRRGG